jgi:hypothetical protein
MPEFEIRYVNGNWVAAKFSNPDVDPDDETACGLLLAREVKTRKLPGSTADYYIKALSRRRGWRVYRPGT